MNEKVSVKPLAFFYSFLLSLPLKRGAQRRRAEIIPFEPEAVRTAVGKDIYLTPYLFWHDPSTKLKKVTIYENIYK